MAGSSALKGLILGTACTLVTDEVGPRAAQSSGTYGLMGIDHDVIVGCPLDGMLVMVDFELTVVMFTTRDDIAYIAGLDSIIAVILHELVSTIHVLLVIHHRRRCLVMHHDFNTT